jgi:thiamine biosynthesis lipoprotein
MRARVGLNTPVIRICLTAALLSVFLASCSDAPFVTRRGEVMGTYFHLQAQCGPQTDAALDAASAALALVDAQMSTYKPQSNLMMLNGAAVGEPVTVGAAVVEVLALAETVRSESDGAFNVAIGRLIDAWGFGAGGAEPAPVLEQVQRLRPPAPAYALLDGDRAQRLADVLINLSAVAKGYGVDRAADVLAAHCPNFMVDVGGEVRVWGRNPGGTPWRIGIETPSLMRRGVERVLALEGRAVATSGDYRNYREVQGRRVSHTIDPRSAAPISHRLASVTVVHDTCAQADAYATALNVLGEQEGMALAETLGLAAYFLIRADDGFEARYTAPMRQHLADSP